MYPRVSDIFRDLFGIDVPLPIYSFGLMVAIAFLTAAFLTRHQLDRMHREGLIGTVPAKVKDKKGRERTEQAPPSIIVWPTLMLAVVLGIAGGKLFHILEYPRLFLEAPLATIFSPAGLTFFGGLICASIGVALYVRSKGLFPVFFDAVAPGVMLAYGIGRIGCYLAGDGDWGIASRLADKPGWIPDWLWSETFPNNILGIDLLAQHPGYDGVYPTMLYEFAMGVALFGVLWALRRHPFLPGWLFAMYMVLAGIQRLTIEQIRVNVIYDIFGWQVTQAELISAFLIITGMVLLALRSKRRPVVRT
jgi:phosphatidylglycerol---prolipoprotein diacylglyceryl transferase